MFVCVVVPATCGLTNLAMPYRCTTGACASDYSLCGYPVNCGIQCNGGPGCIAQAANTTCPCPSPTQPCPCTSFTQCSQPLCVSNLNLCPVGYNWDVCPPGFVHCASGSCRASAADCPSTHMCPPAYYLCPDSYTCVTSFAQCPATWNTICTAPNAYLCFDGRCAPNAESCPTVKTCPKILNGAQLVPQVLCPDGSCQPSASQCLDTYACYAPAAMRCQVRIRRSLFLISTFLCRMEAAVPHWLTARLVYLAPSLGCCARAVPARPQWLSAHSQSRSATLRMCVALTARVLLTWLSAPLALLARRPRLCNALMAAA